MQGERRWELPLHDRDRRERVASPPLLPTHWVDRSDRLSRAPASTGGISSASAQIRHDRQERETGRLAALPDNRSSEERQPVQNAWPVPQRVVPLPPHHWHEQWRV